MSADVNMKIARNLFDAFNSDELERAIGMAAEKFILQVVAFGQTFEGRERFRRFMQNFRTAFPDITIEVEHQVATDDEVVNEFRWSGTHTGPLHTPGGQVPATGRSVEARACEVWRIENGELVSVRHYSDAASLLRQLGVLP